MPCMRRGQISDARQEVSAAAAAAGEVRKQLAAAEQRLKEVQVSAACACHWPEQHWRGGEPSSTKAFGWSQLQPMQWQRSGSS